MNKRYSDTPTNIKIGNQNYSVTGTKVRKIGHKVKKPKKKNYIVEIEIDSYGTSIEIDFSNIIKFLENFFNFMTSLFTFSEIVINPETKNIKKIKKLLTRKSETKEDFHENIKEHQEYLRTVDEFIEKVNKKERVKSILFDQEE